MYIGNFRLNMTCGACPEQYDVFLGEDLVGYLRLRHGSFRADYVFEDQDEQVYYANPKGDGVFEQEERFEYLSNAIAALEKKHFNFQFNKQAGYYYD